MIVSSLACVSAATQIPTAHDVAGGRGGSRQEGFDPCQQHDYGDLPGVRALGGGNHDGVTGFEFGKRQGGEVVQHLTEVARASAAHATATAAGVPSGSRRAGALA